MAIQIHIQNSSRINGISRIGAEVEGAEVWFESPDIELMASPEGFASAFLIPALKHQHALEIGHRLDPVWKTNAFRVQNLLQSWWGWSPVKIQDGPKQTISIQRPIEATGLYFTSGVDSFYSLLNTEYKNKIRYLIFVHGYDFSLKDEWRAEQTISAIRSIAESLSIKVIVIRTNLREIALVNTADWGDEYHGSALAAVGHFLGGVSDQIIISSSNPYAVPQTWGSRWDLDPLWSSSRVSFLHVGADVYRSEKLRRMAHAPLIQKHLRVCWRNKKGILNCGECEKCIRTMLVLMQCESMDLFPRFNLCVERDQWEAFVEEKVPKVAKNLVYIYEELNQRHSKDPGVRCAIRGIMIRSKNPLIFGISRLRVLFRKIIRRLRRAFSKFS